MTSSWQFGRKGLRQGGFSLFMLAVSGTQGFAGWRATGPFGGDAEVIRAIPGVRDMVVAASRNGLIYESKNGGASWENIFFPPQLAGVLHSLEVDPKESGVWYAGFESENARIAGVYRTLDAGHSWELLPASRGIAVWSLAIWTKDPNIIAAGAADGVYLTNDRGATWKHISPPGDPELRPVVSLAFHPQNADTIYAGTTHLPWKTTDGGVSWKSIHTGMLDDSDVFSIQVDALKPDRVFASACSGVYGSSDAAGHWSKMQTPSGTFRTYFVALDPRKTEVVFAGTTGGLLKSETGGKSWRIVSTHAVRSIAFDPFVPTRIFFASSSGGLLLSGDGGNTIRDINNGFTNRNFTTLAGAGGTLYSSSVYEPVSGGLYRSDNMAFRWSHTGAPANDQILLTAVAPDAPKTVYAAGYHNLFESKDGGTAWSVRQLPPGATKVTALLPLASGAIVLGTEAGLYRADSTNNWSQTGAGNVLKLEASGKNQVAVTQTGGLISADGGLSWKRCAPAAGNAAWYGLTVDPRDSRTVLAATEAGLFRSIDGCSSWTEVRSGLGAQTVTLVIFHPTRHGVAFASQGGRVLESTDSGITWAAFDEEARGGSGPLSLFVLPAAPDKLFALFPRRGIYSMWLGDSPAGQ
jgi:photosystem II stability/assembly factor-like uncharacterized protein